MISFSYFNFKVRSILFLFLHIFCFSTFAQPFEWVKVNESSNLAYARDIVHTDNGYVYSVGKFKDTLDMDPSIAVSNLISEGAEDIYIQKLNVFGDFLWGKRIGNNRLETVKKIHITYEGDILICGTFREQVDFDPNDNIFNMTGDTLFDSSYILKLSSSGDFLWAKQINGDDRVSANSISTDDLGNIIVVGEFKGTADFDPSSSNLDIATVGVGKSLFIQKLNSSGDLLWAKAIGGDLGNTFANDLDIEGNELYITGAFNRVVDFDPGTAIHNLTTITQNFTASFVLKLDSLGDYIWANSVTADYAVVGTVISVENDHVYIGGHYRGIADFDPGSDVVELMSYGVRNGYVQKFDSNGNLVWVNGLRSLGSAKSQVLDLSIDQNDKVLIFGTFSGDTDFDPSEQDYFIAPNGNVDVFFEKFNSRGEYLWIKPLGGGTTDGGGGMSVDYAGNIYSTGFFSNYVDFDLGSNVHYKYATTIYDVFVHKMSQCELLDTLTIDACLIYVSPSGKYVWDENGFYNDFIPDTINEGCFIEYDIDLTVKHVETGLYREGDSFVAVADTATYQWYHCEFNLLLLPGETDKVFEIPQNDPYLVMVTQNGCTDTSECIWVNNLAVLDLSKKNDAVVYYDNETNYLGFEVEAEQAGKIQLRDIFGRIIQSANLSGEETQYLMDVSSFASGMYLVDYFLAGKFVNSYKVIIR